MTEEAKTPPAGKPKSRALLTAGLVLFVALGEGAAFFTVLKFFGGGGPQATYGQESGQHALASAPAPPEDRFAEVVLLQRFKVPNDKSGQTIIYDFDLSVVVAASRKPAMEALVQERGSEISDRVSQIIRQASTRVLKEDDFGTLRLQLRQALCEVAGDDEAIARVLIPRCVPLPTD